MNYEDLAAIDRRHSWKPFTPMQEYEGEDPLIIAAGDGIHLEDVQGRRYLDGVSSLWCNLHGHRQPLIDERIRQQLERIAHSTLLGPTAVPAVELAGRLAALAPGELSRVFYSDSGSEAMEIALKMAFQFWRQNGQPERTRFLTFANGYHGDTIGSVSLGGIGLFHGIFKPLLFETIQAPSPYCYRCPLGRSGPDACRRECLAEADRLIRENASRLAAVVIEPLVQGAGGMILQPPGFLADLARRCAAHDVPLITDEVATGFGRTGKMFAVEHEGVTPDLLALAKGLTGGYLPLAATLATERIYGGFKGAPAENRTFFHGHTYTGNALACAAALGSLEVFAERRVLESLPEKIAAFQAGLAAIGERPQVGEVRSLGLMAGIELVAERAGKVPYPEAARRGAAVCRRARELGLLIRPLGDVVILLPPLAASPADIGEITGLAARAIREETEGSR